MTSPASGAAAGQSQWNRRIYVHIYIDRCTHILKGVGDLVSQDASGHMQGCK